MKKFKQLYIETLNESKGELIKVKYPFNLIFTDEIKKNNKNDLIINYFLEIYTDENYRTFINPRIESLQGIGYDYDKNGNEVEYDFSTYDFNVTIDYFEKGVSISKKGIMIYLDNVKFVETQNKKFIEINFINRIL